jgi:hypothetical protein
MIDRAIIRFGARRALRPRRDQLATRLGIDRRLGNIVGRRRFGLRIDLARRRADIDDLASTIRRGFRRLVGGYNYLQPGDRLMSGRPGAFVAYHLIYGFRGRNGGGSIDVLIPELGQPADSCSSLDSPAAFDELYD